MDIRALTFDVFGTVVDWRGSIITECQTVWGAAYPAVEWGAFADDWREGYQPAMDQVRRGDLPWTSVDDLHRLILDEILVKHNIGDLSEVEKAHLNRVWHRLRPWPDAAAGLNRLREQFICATLSNGNMSLLIDLSRNGGLTWDCVLSSELAGHYKPDAEVYQMASRLLDIPPEHILMVAAHRHDLLAARKTGMRTAFIHRPDEYGLRDTQEMPDTSFDVIAGGFDALADKLLSGAGG
jgi:2-haloacid dehalogenase